MDRELRAYYLLKLITIHSATGDNVCNANSPQLSSRGIDKSRHKHSHSSTHTTHSLNQSSSNDGGIWRNIRVSIATTRSTKAAATMVENFLNLM